jgi:hypothetical protein
MSPPWGDIADGGATTLLPTTTGDEAATVTEYGDPSGQPGTAEATSDTTVCPGTVNCLGVTDAEDSPTDTCAVTVDCPGLATEKSTEPPWTAVVWANRQVAAGPGLPDTSARPEPDFTTNWSSSVATRDPDVDWTTVATTVWFWT